MTTTTMTAAAIVVEAEAPQEVGTAALAVVDVSAAAEETLDCLPPAVAAAASALGLELPDKEEGEARNGAVPHPNGV